MGKRKPANRKPPKKQAKKAKKSVKKPSPPPPMHPARLTPVQLVELLQKSGAKDMTVVKIAADVDAGLPVNDDPPGTINLATYAAWLHRLRRGGGGGR